MNQRAVLMDRVFEGMPERPVEGEMDVTHHFGAGTYVRRSFVPAGKSIRMHVHTYAHMTIVAHGAGSLITDAETRAVKAGDVIEVPAGARHVYCATEDTWWLCVHGTTEEEAKKLYGGEL